MNKIEHTDKHTGPKGILLLAKNYYYQVSSTRLSIGKTIYEFLLIYQAMFYLTYLFMDKHITLKNV